MNILGPEMSGTLSRDRLSDIVGRDVRSNKALIDSLGMNQGSRVNTLKKEMGDAEIDMIRELQQRRKILDENELLSKRYSLLQTDLYYYQNQYERAVRNMGKETQEGAEYEEIKKLNAEKDQLCRILSSTVKENEELQSKAEGLALTQLVAPVLISKLLGDDPVERCEVAIKESNLLKEQIAAEKAQLDEVKSERDKYRRLYEDSVSETRRKITAEKQMRLNLRTELETFADKNLKGTLEAQLKQFQRREENYNESIAKMRDYSDKQKAVNEEVVNENLELKKTIDSREKIIADLELKNMRLQNDLVGYASNLDLAKTERDINAEAKKNSAKQIELMARQIEEMRGVMESSSERMAGLKYEVDMLKREKEFAHEKMITMQDTIKSLTADRDGLTNLRIDLNVEIAQLKSENSALQEELDQVKEGKEATRGIQMSILEKTIPVLQKEKEDLTNELLSKEAISEGSKRLARILMDENLELKNQLEAMLRPDMAVPSAQEQSKKALQDMRSSYEEMFSNLIGKVNQIQKEGEILPIVERENQQLRAQVAQLMSYQAEYANLRHDTDKVHRSNCRKSLQTIIPSEDWSPNCKKPWLTWRKKGSWWPS